MKKTILTLSALLAFGGWAEAQFGVSVRTRDAGGAAADRIRVETGVNNASVRFSNAFLQVDGIAVPAVSAAGTGRIVFDGAQFLVSESGGGYVPMLGGPAGITSLNAQVGAVQTFANDVNVTIASAGNVHTLGWLGQLSAARGGLGIDTSADADGSVLRRNAGAWESLVPGAPGQVLTMSGGLPAWAAVPGDGVGVSSVNGELGPAIAMTAAGTAGLSVAVSGPNTIQYSLADVWVNTAGDTMTGVLNLPAAGLTIGGQAIQTSDASAPNVGSNLVSWDNLTDVPLGFADGTDAVDGGNANLLDGLDSLSFLRSDTSDNYTSGTLTFDLPTTLNVLGTFQLSGQAVNVSDGSAPNLGSNLINWDNLTDVPPGFSDGVDDVGVGGVTSINGETGPAIALTAAGTAGLSVAVSGPNTIQYSLADVWVNTTGDTMTGVLNLPAAGLTIGGQNLGTDDLTPPNAGSNLMHWNNLTGMPADFVDGTDAVDGGNANLLDGLDSLSFLRSDTSDNYTSGTLTFDLPTTLNVLGTFQLSGQTVGVSDATPPNAGSNLFSWDNLTDVPPGFADGNDDSGTGTVTSITAGIGLTATPANPITTFGTIDLANTAVTPGAYTRANITVDAQGRLTAASNGAAINLATEVTGILPLANGGTAADLSGTGGAGQYVKQSAAGAAFTVGTIPAGDLPDLSATYVTLGTAQTITGAKTFSTAPSFTAAGAPFSVSSTTLVTNLNADLLDGLNSTDFLRRNAADTSTAAAAGSYLYAFTNSDAAGSGGLTVISTAGTGVRGQGGTYGLYGTVATGPGTGDFGVYGWNTSAVAGTHVGTYGAAIGAGAVNWGSYGAANNATTSNYGVYGRASGPAVAAENRGVFGLADGAGASVNYGVYGSASGAITNWAGFFTNDVRIGDGVGTDRLSFGTSGIVQIGTHTPGTPSAGDFRYNAGNLLFYDGAVWQTLGVAGGGVTSVRGNAGAVDFAASTGLTITLPGVNPVTYALADTTVTPGAYTRANITVDAQGRLTAASNGAAINLATEVTGILPLANGGTAADLSATGGAGQYVKQSAAGAAFTVGTIGAADLPGNVVYTDTAQTITGAKTFSTAPSFTAAGAPFSVSSTTLVANLNADLLDGIDSTGFVQLAPAAWQTNASTNHAIRINNTAASGDMMNFQKSGTTKFWLSNAGRTMEFADAGDTNDRIIRALGGLLDILSDRSVRIDVDRNSDSTNSEFVVRRDFTAGPVDLFAVQETASGTFAQVNFFNNPSINHVLENLAADPAAGNEGRIIWRSDTNQLKIDTGAAWTTIGGGGITTLNGLGGAVQTFSTNTALGTAPAWNSAGTDHELRIPMAGAALVTAGLISNAQYTTFNNSVDTVTATAPLSSSGGQNPDISLTGIVGLANGGTAADLSGTGGAGQYVKQSAAGAAFTVGTIGAADLPSNVVYTDTVQTITGAKTFSTAPSFTAAGAPFSVSSTTLVTNLNADLLDGLSSAAFMPAGTDNWVNTTGDAMTGALSIGLAASGTNLTLTGNPAAGVPMLYVNSTDAFADTGLRISSAASMKAEIDTWGQFVFSNNSGSPNAGRIGGVGFGAANGAVEFGTYPGSMRAKSWAGGAGYIQVEGGTAPPVANGTIYYDSGTNKFRGYENGAWADLVGGGGGITTLNTLSDAVQTFAIGTGGVSPNWSSALGTHTLNIPNASTGGVTAGLISNAQYTTFNNSVDSVTASLPLTSSGGQNPNLALNIGTGLALSGVNLVNTGDTNAADDITGSGVATRVAFFSGAQTLSSNANLFWDNTSSRLGVGTAAPSQLLHVAGDATATRWMLENSNNNVHRGSGQFGQMAGWDPNAALNGVWMEGGDSESGGFYADGDLAVIVSPGDPEILRVYDEDSLPAGSPVFVIDGSGNAVPGTNGVQSLGTTSRRWNQVWTNDLARQAFAYAQNDPADPALGWTSLQSAAITTSGNPVMIICQQWQNTLAGYCAFRVVRGATVIGVISSEGHDSTGDRTQPVIWVDPVGAGTWTYTLEYTSNAAPLFYERCIQVIELNP